ncbi:sulfurtransferase [Streptomyces sp. H10-C2]|uniref:sulfurtransferase n=1 Tax=unclassified Streptomyces TaxID=2593676 RepID=UPI0024BB83CE|nr:MULTISPECIES: sulfurtransferase [unclassified Streptomyces]MDJ0341556.1 sulfurtransferase [Streptomyces sp. PH10-H1]MDJ0371342.1 sulfurtransferase [Streptomyces sp. H10-C2]
MESIIAAAELASELSRTTVLDVRWQLGGPPGRPAYEAGHIPGAVYIDLDTELAGTPGQSGRHPLPDPEVFGAAMRAAGVGMDRDVVVYDDWQGWGAARAWWMLRWTGHPRVRVLDGGLAAWTAAGQPLETGTADPVQGNFTPAVGSMALLTADDAALLARTGVLFDARAAERYRGDVEPIDRVGGHIPGAVSAPTMENVMADGRFLPPAELLARFVDLGVKESAEVGAYCGSGVSGAHEVLALAVAGIPAALYVGSWSEWSADPDRPVATGDQPG